MHRPWPLLMLFFLWACAHEPPVHKENLVGKSVQDLINEKGRPLRSYTHANGNEVYEYIETDISMSDSMSPVGYSSLYQQDGDFNRRQCLRTYEIAKGMVVKTTSQGPGCP